MKFTTTAHHVVLRRTLARVEDVFMTHVDLFVN